MCVQFRSEQFISSTICGKWKNFQARKAWKELGLVEEQQINFDEFKRALDLQWERRPPHRSCATNPAEPTATEIGAGTAT
mmetsp:Transcript_18169/g.47461  ORF Transcript_18169/g.47461 Transcript_18169/m.47461 type:complete len:80 (+) Transcript_18169:714-953(+)